MKRKTLKREKKLTPRQHSIVNTIVEQCQKCHEEAEQNQPNMDFVNMQIKRAKHIPKRLAGRIRFAVNHFEDARMTLQNVTEELDEWLDNSIWEGTDLAIKGPNPAKMQY